MAKDNKIVKKPKDSQTVPKTTKKIQKAAKQNAAAIIQKDILPEKKKSLIAKNLNVGEFFSRMIYEKVLKVSNSKVFVITHSGKYKYIPKFARESESYSASQYTQEKRVTRSELVDVLENVKGRSLPLALSQRPLRIKPSSS